MSKKTEIDSFLMELENLSDEENNKKISEEEDSDDVFLSKNNNKNSSNENKEYQKIENTSEKLLLNTRLKKNQRFKNFIKDIELDRNKKMANQSFKNTNT